MNEKKPCCDNCQQPLVLKRTCTAVTFRCPQCNREFPLSRFIDQMDEALEAQLSGLRCDRI